MNWTCPHCQRSNAEIHGRNSTLETSVVLPTTQSTIAQRLSKETVANVVFKCLSRLQTTLETSVNEEPVKVAVSSEVKERQIVKNKTKLYVSFHLHSFRV